MTEVSPQRSRRRDPGRYQDILDIFTRNVARRGYAASNFSEIANELGISKGTIVHHYGTKDRLFAQMHDTYMQRRLDEAKDIVGAFESPAERLAGLLLAWMLYQQIDRDSTIAYQREVATLATNDSLARGRTLRADYLALVRDVLNDGMNVGQFRKLDTKVQSLLMFGSSQWAWTWFDPEGELTAIEAAAQLVQLGLGSLLIDRLSLDSIADPQGPVATAVQAILDRHARARQNT